MVVFQKFLKRMKKMDINLGHEAYINVTFNTITVYAHGAFVFELSNIWTPWKWEVTY